MGNIESFHENDVNSIKQMANKISNMRQENVNEALIKKNAEKAVKCLRGLSKSDYKTEKAEQLLRLMSNVTLKISQYLYSKDIIKSIVQLDIHGLFKVMLTYYMSITDTEYPKRKYSIGLVLATILSINYDIVVVQNIQSGIVKLSLEMLENFNFLDDKELLNVDSLDLYDRITAFLYTNALRLVIRDELINLNIVSRLMNHKQKLLYVMQTHGKNNELLEIMYAKIAAILSYLLVEEELEKSDDISTDIVNSLLNMINKTIEHSINNQIRKNTKFYFTYEIGTSTKYRYANNFLYCLLRIVVNDKIKQIIFQLNGLASIIKIFQDDEDEYDQEVCCQLMASLCFNLNIRKQIKLNDGLMKLIHKKSKKTTNKAVLDSLAQILGMVNETIEEKLAHNETHKWTQPHLMISYSHENKVNCVKLHQLLKSYGYRTWIDLEHPFDNLLDGMVKAIMHASVVLICYSDAYKRTTQCRLEAEYAFKKDKKIISIKVEPKYTLDGWLKILNSVKLNLVLCHDLHEKSPSLKILHGYLVGLIVNKNDHGLSIKKIDRIVKISSNEIDSIKTWTNIEVKKWLALNELSVCTPLLAANQDGDALLSLYNMQKNNHGYFCQTIDTEIEKKNLKINLTLKLRFFNALASLI